MMDANAEDIPDHWSLQVFPDHWSLQVFPDRIYTI